MGYVQQITYILRSIVLHEGRSPVNGHYSALRLQAGAWWKCSDMAVDEVAREQALRPSPSTYLCLYEREGKLYACSTM